MSLAVNLRQVLKAEDERQILVLVTGVDAKTIAATAKELSGDEATALIDRLSKFVSVDPRRLPVVTEWVRELVLSHASFISSQTHTKLKLKPILDLLRQRVAHQPELNRMKMMTEAILQNSLAQSSDVMTPTNFMEEKQPTMKWIADS